MLSVERWPTRITQDPSYSFLKQRGGHPSFLEKERDAVTTLWEILVHNHQKLVFYPFKLRCVGVAGHTWNSPGLEVWELGFKSWLHRSQAVWPWSRQEAPEPQASWWQNKVIVSIPPTSQEHSKAQLYAGKHSPVAGWAPHVPGHSSVRLACSFVRDFAHTVPSD